jgi:hypothetical protein
VKKWPRLDALVKRTRNIICSQQDLTGTRVAHVRFIVLLEKLLPNVMNVEILHAMPEFQAYSHKVPYHWYLIVAKLFVLVNPFSLR